MKKYEFKTPSYSVFIPVDKNRPINNINDRAEIFERNSELKV